MRPSQVTPDILADIGLLGLALFNKTQGKFLRAALAQTRLANGQLAERLQLTQFTTMQGFLRENAPTFIVPSEVEQDCLDRNALANVRCRDLRRRHRYGAFVTPSSYLLWGIYDAHERIELWSEGEVIDSTSTPGRYIYFSDLTSLLGRGVTLEEEKPLVAMTSKDLPWDVKFPDAEGQEAEEKNERHAVLCYNLLLILQSYPNYFELSTETRQTYSPRKGHGKAPKVYYLRRSPMRPLVAQVFTDSSNLGDSPGTGSRKRPHWRAGHWVRRTHGERFRLTHPDVAELQWSDGRTYHMVWVELCAVNGAGHPEQAEEVA